MTLDTLGDTCYASPMTEKQRLHAIGARTVSRAQALVARAIRRGELDPASSCLCADCGEPAEVYDHRNYAKALEVAPVCRPCKKTRGPGKPYGRKPRNGRAPSGWIPQSEPR